MYAIVADGPRQFRVEPGQEVTLDLQDLSKGDEYTFPQVLAVSGADGFQLGAPTVDGVAVIAEVVGVEQGKKIYVQKFRRRKNSRRRTGHRQMYTRVRITSIGGVTAEKAPAKEETASEE